MSKKILKADFVFGYVIRDVNLLYWNKCIAAMKKGKKMERYKVILVDDEAEVIDMIEKKIHWNDLGFEVAGSATNGVKALELVEKLQPDVVLTDIKMPYMDGLELSRRLNREYPNIYIMLCTGFDEFEYAKDKITQITDACDRFCRWAYRIMGAVVTAGIGTVCDSLYEISLSYERAREAVSYRVLYGTKRAINIGEIVPKEQIKPVQSEESRMQMLFRAIRIGDSAEIERAAHGEMEKLHKNTETMSQYNLATMEIVSGFFKFCTDNSLDFNKISGNMQNIYEKVSQMDESSLTAWIVQMSETISEKLKCARNSSARRLIVEAQNIVQERYMEADISLDEVCAVLGVSNSYFSSVFKKEAGKSFISYLTDYRMDIAAEMILNTDEKSYTIAEKVGYLDANYFSYVFKKKFGVSPSKYRASVK